MNMQITKKDVASARRIYWLLLFAPVFTIIPCIGQLGFGIYLIVLLFWAFSKKPFLKVHARQGLSLCLLELILVSVGSFSSSDLGIIFSVMAFGLWVFGNIGGIIQAGHGRSWIGNIRAEIVKDSTPQVTKGQVPTAEKSRNEKAVESYLDVFRTGAPSIREAAVRRLEALGQVEIF
jgi:hypothetical protein